MLNMNTPEKNKTPLEFVREVRQFLVSVLSEEIKEGVQINTDMVKLALSILEMSNNVLVNDCSPMYNPYRFTEEDLSRKIMDSLDRGANNAQYKRKKTDGDTIYLQ